MLGKKFASLVSGADLENAEGEYKQSKRLGQYRICDKAIFKADGTYVPFATVKECIQDQTSVHVSGCCAGGVPVERIVFVTENESIPLIFDNKKQVETVVLLCEKSR